MSELHHNGEAFGLIYYHLYILYNTLVNDISSTAPPFTIYTYTTSYQTIFHPIALTYIFPFISYIKRSNKRKITKINIFNLKNIKITLVLKLQNV